MNRPCGTAFQAVKYAALGVIVAMAIPVRHEADTAGVVAMSGYYFWTFRPDVLLAGLGALPIVGDLLRYTVSPLLNRLLMPLVKRTLFSPGAVPARFDAAFSTAMAVRPSQIRATSQDGALMIPGALALRDHYKDLSLPVVIMAGEGDKVVFKRRAEQLSAAVKSQRAHYRSGGGSHGPLPGHGAGRRGCGGRRRALLLQGRVRRGTRPCRHAQARDGLK